MSLPRQPLLQPDNVIIPKHLFDLLLRHCETCPDFQLRQELSQTQVVISEGRRCPTHQPVPQQPTTRYTGRRPDSQRIESQPGSQQSTGASANGRKPRKNEAVDWFLRHAPRATEWRTRQNELGLNTVGQYEGVIRAFTARTKVSVLQERDRQPQNELLDVAERLALLVKSSLANAKLQRSFANFQVLILLSYCEILRQTGVQYEVIDRIIRHVTDAKESDRKRLLNSALWINGRIADLVRRGWQIQRATELFFVGT